MSKVEMQVLIDNVRAMSRAAELLRRESEVLGIGLSPYRKMAGAIWDFIDHTAVPEALWAEMKFICPSVFNSGSLDLVPESYFTEF